LKIKNLKKKQLWRFLVVEGEQQIEMNFFNIWIILCSQKYNRAIKDFYFIYGFITTHLGFGDWPLQLHTSQKGHM